ncbi:amidase domain-containing protein [Microbacterium indicum]|uniref:amidase domain-containing protein n=1 Tax=Microbacterium indicum TaxID=358100 RepID=UPI0003F5A8E2|nr:amidase domain-containing protein [Microbacterium indicum]
MSDLESRTARRSAAREAKRRAQRRGAVILGGGGLVIVVGVWALVAGLTGGGDAPSASDTPSAQTTLSGDAAGRAGETGGDASDPDGEAAQVEEEPAVVDALSASTGSLAAGETVQITGSGLAGVTSVAFGDQDAKIAATTDTSVDVVVPASYHYVAGQVGVTVSEGDAAVDGDLSYTYEAQTAVDRQLQYAMKYWKDYNSATWGDYNPSGGDCMNFVSQALAARGWQQSTAWYNDGTSSTENWRYVPTFQTWMTANAAELGVTQLSLDQRDQVKIGDLVVFDWNDTGTPDHIQMISNIIENDDGTRTIQMVGHNEDSDYRDLDQTITVDHPGANAWFWSIPE